MQKKGQFANRRNKFTKNSIKLFQKLRMYNWRKKLQSLEISTSTTYVT